MDSPNRAIAMGNILHSARRGNPTPVAYTQFRHNQRIATLKDCPRTAEAIREACSELCKELCIDEEKEQMQGFSIDVFGPVLPLFLLPRLRPRHQPYFCIVRPRQHDNQNHTCAPAATPLALSSLLPYRRKTCTHRHGYDAQALPAAAALFSQLQSHGYAVLMVDDDHGRESNSSASLEGTGGSCSSAAGTDNAAAAAEQPADALCAWGRAHLHAHAQAVHHAVALLTAPPDMTARLVLRAPQRCKLVGYPKAPGKGRQFYQVRRCSLPLPLPPVEAEVQPETLPVRSGDSKAGAAVDCGSGATASEVSGPQLSCRQAIQHAFDYAEDVSERCMFAVAAVMGWDPEWVSSLLDPEGAQPWQERTQEWEATSTSEAAAQKSLQRNLHAGPASEGAAGQQGAVGHTASGTHVQHGQADSTQRQVASGATTKASRSGGLWPGALCTECTSPKHGVVGESHPPSQQAPPAPSRAPQVGPTPDHAGAGAQYGSNVMRWYRYLRPEGHPPPTLVGGTPGHFHATGVHTDLGFITVAMRASLPGLRILHPGTLQFQDVETGAQADTYLVFAGEQLAVLTRGALQASVHYVEESFMGQPRYSSPFFLRPRPSAVIWPTQVHLSSQMRSTTDPEEGDAERLSVSQQAGKGTWDTPVAGQCPGQACAIGEPPLMTALFAPGEPITAAAFAQKVMMKQRPWSAGYNSDF